MKIFKPLLLSLLVLAGCTPTQQPAEQVNRLADAYVNEYFTAFPEQAVIWGAPDLYPSKLTDNSLQALEKWHATEDSLLAALHTIDDSALQGSETNTYGFVKNRLGASVNQRACRMEQWRVSPTFTGWQNALSFVFSSLPVETEEQRENAYSRVSQMPEYILTEIDNLKAGIESGYTAPESGVTAVIGQMDALFANSA